MEEGKSQYQPTQKEKDLAESLMTDRQRKLSEETEIENIKDLYAKYEELKKELGVVSCDFQLVYEGGIVNQGERYSSVHGITGFYGNINGHDISITMRERNKGGWSVISSLSGSIDNVRIYPEDENIQIINDLFKKFSPLAELAHKIRVHEFIIEEANKEIAESDSESKKATEWAAGEPARLAAKQKKHEEEKIKLDVAKKDLLG